MSAKPRPLPCPDDDRRAAAEARGARRGRYRVAIVDTPPAITEAIGAVVRSAALVLIPTRPSPHDLRAVGSTVELVQAAGKPFVFAVTQAKPNARLTVQAMAALSEHGIVAPAIVHDRVDYAGSMIDGRTVQETDREGNSAAEMAELWRFIKAQIAKSTKARKEGQPMSKKPAAALSAGLVAVKGAAAPAPDMPGRGGIGCARTPITSSRPTKLGRGCPAGREGGRWPL